MLRGMYSSISAMINLQASQSVITNNMANINTTGFKGETLVSKSFDELVLSNRDKYVNGQGKRQELGSLNPGVRIDEVTTNYTQGTIVSTDNDTDFAINGKGFFTIEDRDGNRRYTRDGVFKVNSMGYLVTTSGDSVLGVNQGTNALEPIYVGNQKISMDNRNNILLDSRVAYRFNIVDFQDYNTLNKVGQNQFEGNNEVAANNYNIQNKVKETSNVDLIDVTSALMSNMRAFEANQKVVQIMDATLSKIANEVGSIR
ncbi:MAG: flagellar hook-basal body complex protein [Clostridium sp.]|nr:flagellar hook-basal body complex protein [Clostridium sp.]MDU7085251.1 flagellar hook-basal body complex protein [Clostridium sp.]